MWRIHMFFEIAVADVCAAAVFIVPLFLILGKFLFKSAKRTALYMLLALYLTALLSVVGFPEITHLVFDTGFNAVPLIGMIESPAEAFLNVLLFVPFGFFLPILWEKFRNPLAALFSGFLLSFTVEIAQIFTFRISDINDLIANTFGAAIGYLLAQLITKGFTRLAVKGTRFEDIFVVLGSVFAITFTLSPLVSGFVLDKLME